MSYVHCGIAPPAAVRLLESEGRHFSKFTVFGFIPSTAYASVVPRHGSVNLGLGEFFSRFTPLHPPYSVSTGSPLVACSYSPRSGGLVCRKVNGFCIKLHYCTPGLLRTNAGSTPFKGTTSPVPFEPLMLLLLLIIFNVPPLLEVLVRQLMKTTSKFRAVCNPPPLHLLLALAAFKLLNLDAVQVRRRHRDVLLYPYFHGIELCPSAFGTASLRFPSCHIRNFSFVSVSLNNCPSARRATAANSVCRKLKP